METKQNTCVGAKQISDSSFRNNCVNRGINSVYTCSSVNDIKLHPISGWHFTTIECTRISDSNCVL